ncbi:hypothetical protein RIF29_39679 [Crotalaria pallida]|uniref:Uncharacterized protein n=1 Tax=Crotalaria pallida TaxID=3830 RepID=A0AAN9E2G9_CROPI
MSKTKSKSLKRNKDDASSINSSYATMRVSSVQLQGLGFAGVGLEWQNQYCFVIVNVYSPCALEDKRRLWKDLILMRQSSSIGPWCVLGDFNFVWVLERFSIAIESYGFDMFISKMDLFDIPLSGKKFTWFSFYGVVMSKQDMVLVSDVWETSWVSLNQWALPHDVSDHYPIVDDIVANYEGLSSEDVHLDFARSDYWAWIGGGASFSTDVAYQSLFSLNVPALSSLIHHAFRLL